MHACIGTFTCVYTNVHICVHARACVCVLMCSHNGCMHMCIRDNVACANERKYIYVCMMLVNTPVACAKERIP